MFSDATLSDINIVKCYILSQYHLNILKNTISGIITERPHLNCLKQDDPQLVEVFKKKYLDPPSTLPYNFQVPSNNS